MSVLAKGVKLPESCSRCDMSAQISTPFGDIIRCRFGKIVKTPINDPHDVSNRRYFNCPLVALPDKHGRLIDGHSTLMAMDKFFGDEIKRLGYNSYEEADCETQLYLDGIINAMAFVMMAKTVVQAEDNE